jgi:Tfp pilus assembly protein PilV
MRTIPLDLRPPTRHRRRPRLPEPASADGFLLLEVVMSAFLVAVIIVASMTGFEAAGRASAEERHHNQAAQLASEAQEQLRSDPASVLNALYAEPHMYAKTVGGTTYAIEQKVEPLNSSGTATGCSATAGSSQSGANVSVESYVTWPTASGSRKTPGIRERGIISPPVGSAEEIDVLNGQEPEGPVANVNTIVSYPATTPTGTLEATTGAGGCTVFSGLPYNSAKVEVPEKLDYVTPSGALKFGPKEVAIAANITTHTPVLFNEGGRVKAEYTYKGSTTYKGETVTGETFSAFNNRMDAEPNFIVGAAGASPFEYEAGGERKYKALTGSAHNATTAITPAASSYANGDLFPFPSAWLVSAGDCKSNNVTAEDQSNAVVLPGQTSSVTVPLSRLKVNVYTGTKLLPLLVDTKEYPATITDTACTSEPAPDNATAANLKHTQVIKNDHLEHPFQPFGQGQLCVSLPILGSGLFPRRYTFNYSLATANGATINIYETEVLTEILEGTLKKLSGKEEVENEAKEKVLVKWVIEEVKGLTAPCP